jgi:hypothetical protein
MELLTKENGRTLRKNLLQCYFVHPKSCIYLGANPDFRDEKPAASLLGYDTAHLQVTDLKLDLLVS